MFILYKITKNAKKCISYFDHNLAFYEIWLNVTELLLMRWWNLNATCMGESFQDYSWIQDFEADFPQKVSLKILN